MELFLGFAGVNGVVFRNCECEWDCFLDLWV